MSKDIKVLITSPVKHKKQKLAPKMLVNHFYKEH